MKRVWFDVTNPPHVHFQVALNNDLKDQYDTFFTARDFSETTKLLEKKYGKPFNIIGGHYGKRYIDKVLGLLKRFKELNRYAGDFDISLSNGSEAAIWLSKLKGKHAIAFGDNDQARQWTYGFFVDFAFFPDCIETSLLNRQGLTNNKLYQFHGFKEDIYIADYEPDREFLNQLPFEKYVLLRPENIQANYIKKGNVKSIVPELLTGLSRRGHNVLYLPRYDLDRKYAENLDNVHMPEKTLNGLDACYYADAVLTGAGTLAREAACLGVPAVSFYAGKDLLTVDKTMIRKGWTFFSRNSDEILKHLKVIKKRSSSINRSKSVKSEVIDKLKETIGQLT